MTTIRSIGDRTTKRQSNPAPSLSTLILRAPVHDNAQTRALAESSGAPASLPNFPVGRDILDAVSDALVLEPRMRIPSTFASETTDEVRKLHEVGDRFTQRVDDLRRTHLTIDEMLGRSAQLGDKERVRELSESFANNMDGLQGVTTKLSTLIEAGLDMIAEREPARLTEKFFDAACKVVASGYAVVAMLDVQGEKARQVLAKGVDVELFRGGAGTSPLVESLLTAGRAVRAPRSEGAVPGLPAGHPPVHSFLGLPIATKDYTYGWFYFADRIGEPAFTDEDERVAAILAAELAMLYENATLYTIVQHHAARLELNVTERRRSRDELAETESRFRQMVECIHEVFFLVDAIGNQTLHVSSAFEDIWGRSRESLYAEPDEWLEWIHPEERARVMKGWEECRRTGYFDSEYRILRPDGTMRWIHARGYPIKTHDNVLVRIAGIAHDVTTRKLAEEKIRRLNRVHAVLSGINSLIVRATRRDELFREASRIAVLHGGFVLAWIGTVDRAAMQLRPSAWQVADPSLLHRLHGLALSDDPKEARGILARAVSEKSARTSNDVAIDPDVELGDEYAARGVRSMAVLPLMVADAVVGVLALHSSEVGFFDDEEMELLCELAGDISFALDHIEKSEQLDYLAYYDALTGLANRTLFQERLAQRLRAGNQLALVVVDVERFKVINDAFGRLVGDDLLKQIAQRLTQAIDPTAIARISADNFAFVLPDIKREAEVARMLEERLRVCFGEPFTTEDTEIRVVARAGIALFPNDGSDGETLLANADSALRRAKESGERYLFYTHQMTKRISERLTLENDLRRALANEEFVLYYQPKVELEKREIVGAEALIRWRSPDRGLVLPGVFIPLLEETGLILEVGAWVLRRAVVDHRHMLRQGFAAPRIAANVSARQLRQRDFVEVLEAAIRMGAVPTGLDIEVTESVLMEDVTVNIQRLQAIGALDVKVAIDDFGTGYSSLAYLTKLPVQALKIDRAFVEAMLGDTDTTMLVSTIISLAHSLRLNVVAEGVETEEQARMLRLLGCDEIQGHLVSRPLPLEDFTRLLPRRV